MKLFFYIIHVVLFLTAYAFARLWRKSTKRTLLYAAVLFACAVLATAVGIVLQGADRSILDIAEKLSVPLRWRGFTIKYSASVLVAEAGLVFLAKVLKIRLHAMNVGRRPVGSVIGALCTAAAVFLCIGTAWARARFPMESPVTVYFTLVNNPGPASSDIYAEFAAIVIAALLAGIALPVLHRCVPRLAQFTHLSLRAGGVRFIPLELLFSICAVALLSFFLWWTWRVLKVPQYIAIIREERGESVDSDFYREEYIVPEYAAVTFPEHRRNLVVILMESMESSYASREDGGMFSRNFELTPNFRTV